MIKGPGLTRVIVIGTGLTGVIGTGLTGVIGTWLIGVIGQG